MTTVSSLLASSPGASASGLRNRLAKFKSPSLNVIHDSREDKLEDSDNDEILMQSFTSVSSGESSEEVVDRMSSKKGVKDEEQKEGEKEVDEQRAERHQPIRQFSSRSSANTKTPLQRRRTRSSSNVYRESDRGSSSSGWLGLDLSIIVALVSPLGNLLTGGDHIKNVLLLLLLVYYLHQLVEGMYHRIKLSIFLTYLHVTVPWSLYRASLTDPSTYARLQGHAAHSELHNREVFYLTLTVLSPFVGATLLRVVAISITGDPETLSWFSTGLFVLATGLRPWSHLVQRLKDHSHALQELVSQRAVEIEEEETEKDQDQEVTTQITDALQCEVDGLLKHVASLDSRVKELSNKNHHEWTDLAEHVAEVVDSVEDALRRHRTAITRANQTTEARFTAYEARFEALEAALVERTCSTNGILVAKGEDPPRPYLRGEQLRNFVWEVIALPWTAAVVCWMYIAWTLPRLTQVPPPSKSKGKKREISGLPPTSIRHAALESIPEEDGFSLAQADSDCTLVCEVPESVASVILANLLKILLSPMLIFLRLAYSILTFPKTFIRSPSA